MNEDNRSPLLFQRKLVSFFFFKIFSIFTMLIVALQLRIGMWSIPIGRLQHWLQNCFIIASFCLFSSWPNPRSTEVSGRCERFVFSHEEHFPYFHTNSVLIFRQSYEGLLRARSPRCVLDPYRLVSLLANFLHSSEIFPCSVEPGDGQKTLRRPKDKSMYNGIIIFFYSYFILSTLLLL